MNRAGLAIRELFTGPDGETHDPARWLWIIGIVAFLALTGYELYRTGHFDMMNFGLAYATLLGGGAAGVKIKESTEPKGDLSSASILPPYSPAPAPRYTPTDTPPVFHPTMSPPTYDPSVPPE